MPGAVVVVGTVGLRGSVEMCRSPSCLGEKQRVRGMPGSSLLQLAVLVKRRKSWVCQHMPVKPALRWLRQKDGHKFLRPVWALEQRWAAQKSTLGSRELTALQAQPQVKETHSGPPAPSAQGSSGPASPPPSSNHGSEALSSGPGQRAGQGSLVASHPNLQKRH